MKAELKLVIAGNHDASLDQDFCKRETGSVDMFKEAVALWTSQEAKDAGVHYLEEGLHPFTLRFGAVFTVYASQYTPQFGISAFQYPTTEDRYYPAETIPAVATNVATPNSMTPDGQRVDRMMTHGPAKYLLDACEDGSAGGCEHLRRAVCRAKPLLHCFGHGYPSRGFQRIIWREREDIPHTGEHADDNQDSEMVMPSKEFVGEASSRKRGYAKLSPRCVEEIKKWTADIATECSDWKKGWRRGERALGGKLALAYEGYGFG